MMKIEIKVTRPYFHVAPVLGVPTIFASLEYPRDKPPKVIEVDCARWVRVDGDVFDGAKSD